MPTQPTVESDDDHLASEQQYLDRLLRRTIEQVHREADRMARRRLATLLTVVTLALVASLALGALVGIHLPRQPAGSDTPAPATVFAATDPVSRTWLGVDMTPEQGGALLRVAVTGLSAGIACRLYVLGVDGARIEVGGWRGSSGSTGPLALSVYLDPGQLAAVELTTTNGVDLVAGKR